MALSESNWKRSKETVKEFSSVTCLGDMNKEIILKILFLARGCLANFHFGITVGLRENMWFEFNNRWCENIYVMSLKKDIELYDHNQKIMVLALPTDSPKRILKQASQ